MLTRPMMYRSGQQNGSIAKASHYFGVKDYSLTNRMRTNGETCEQAILNLKPRLGRGKEEVYFSKEVMLSESK
jgi:hypothetical protein